MIPTEKRIASFIKDHWEEKEDCCGDLYLRVYADRTFDGAVQDCRFSDCNPTDVLCFEYAKRENGAENVQMFISTPEDDGQEWFAFQELSRRDRMNVVRLFEEMIAKGGIPLKTQVIAIS